MVNSLYLHIPFCKYICAYCDFTKKYIQKQDTRKYVENVIEEWRLKFNGSTDSKHGLETKVKLQTIYIGGGTPSALPLDELEVLLTFIERNVELVEDYEYTFECNPDDITLELLMLLKRCKVNRLSIGIQTLNQEILLKLKRNVTILEIERGIATACEHFANVSVDLMYNLPRQSLTDIENSLEFISKYNIKHISYYSLILEKNTILDTQKFKLWNEEKELKVYEYLRDRLAELGFNQYEISNYAQVGFESKHNQVYWHNQEYYALGIGASGYEQRTRYTNTSSLQTYYTKIASQQLPIYETEAISSESFLEEKIMLGLRLRTGVELTEEIISKLDLDKRKFSVDANYLRITDEYVYQSNELIIEMIEQICELWRQDAKLFS
ncbi:MAG: radical SAM family heme chaperone HemW, partial [Mycoplasmatales bacterium]